MKFDKLLFIVGLVVFTLLINPLYAQSYSDSLKIVHYQDSINHYSFIDPDKCLFFINKAIDYIPIEEYQKFNDLFLLKGQQYFEKADYEILDVYGDSLMLIGKEYDEPLILAHGEYFKFVEYYMKEDWGNAKNNLNNAVTIYLDYNHYQVVDAYIYLGMVFFLNGILDKSLNYHQLSIQKINEFENISNRTKISAYVYYAYSASFNFAIDPTYIDTTETYNALAKHYMSIDDKHQMYHVVTVKMNDILVNIEKGNLDKAGEIVEEGFDIVTSDSYYSYCFYTITAIKYYLAIQDYDLAEKYTDEVIELSTKNNNKEYLHQAYFLKSKIKYAQDKPFESFQFITKADSVFRKFMVVENLETVKDLEENIEKYKLNYENEKIKNELLANQIFSQTLLYSLLTFCLVIIVLGYAYFNIRKKKRLLDHNNNMLFEQKQILVDQQNALNEMNRKLIFNNHDLSINKMIIEESNEKLEYYGQRLSHDLKTPIRIMTSFAGLLDEKIKEIGDEKSQEMIDFIVNNGVLLQNMIDETLNIAIITNDIKIYNVDLNTILDVCKASLKREIKNSNTIINSEKLPVIKGYKYELVQLFLNLIQNAIKFSKKNVPPQIDIGFREIENQYHISFTDNGIGIEKISMSKIFDLFQSKDYAKGHGIGLNSCVLIAKDYNGDVLVESELGVGSTFTLILAKERNTRIMNL